MSGLARWRCETCRGELTMPAEFAEWGYACCYAAMTYLGVEPAPADRNPKGQDAKRLGAKHESAVTPKAAGAQPGDPQ